MSQTRNLYRSVYLITYSQADPTLVPDREAFSHIVTNAFVNVTTARPVHWVCAREFHADGGIHYHMALKLSKQQRWLVVRNHIEREDTINVNFSDAHTNYYSAYKYATKEDDQPLHSNPHPDLGNGPPRTMAASQARHDAARGPSDKRNTKRLSAFDVSEIISSKLIKSPLELMALAKSQKDEGKTDLAEFIINKGLYCTSVSLPCVILNSSNNQSF